MKELFNSIHKLFLTYGGSLAKSMNLSSSTIIKEIQLFVVLYVHLSKQIINTWIHNKTQNLIHPVKGTVHMFNIVKTEL